MNWINDLLLFFHFVGLALTLGSGFATLRLSGEARKWSEEARGPLLVTVFSLAKNTSMGLGLLILTGLGMMFYKGVGTVFAWGGPFFHAKLTLVVVLIGLLGYMQVAIKKARQNPDGGRLQKVGTIGRILLAVSLLVVACAVLAFH